jgi:Tfp pilus assembly protein PilW
MKKPMLKIKHARPPKWRGFTLIELLIVMTLIIILIGAIVFSMNSARAKAQLSSFKSETRGSLAGFSVNCISGTIATPADTTYTNWGAFTVNNCGSLGTGKFSITAVPTNVTINCTATVTETGVTYSGVGC